MTYDKNLSPSKSIHNIKKNYRRLKSVEKDVLFRYLDIIKLNDVEDVSDIVEEYSTTIRIDQNCGIYELIQETSPIISDKRPYDKIIDGYILMAYKTMEDMYSEEFAHNWKLWSGVRHLCAKIPAPYHFEGMHFYKELTNICQFKYLLIIEVKKLLFYVATTLNVLQTVKPKLCAYVGVYKEIFNVNIKKDGTCNNNNINTFSIANINKKELKEDIYACRKENEIKICDNIIEKKLNDKKKMSWCSSVLRNGSVNCQYKNNMINTSKMKEEFDVSIGYHSPSLNYKYIKNIGNNKIKEENKKLNIQSSLPFSFLYREQLNSLNMCSNKNDNISYNYCMKNDLYNNNFLNNNNLLKRNSRNYLLYDLEELRKELLMDEKYFSPIYSRNEWLTYPNHEASIIEFQFFKLLNPLKS
uniref:CRAL-TRIO domain-containing protein n=1 Tax=Strongyloides venezuelensis TaxID=75913 RepID=A0A0K0FBI5_STRVS